MRILVLEDEQDIAGPVVSLLRSAKYEVALARDLDEAREAMVTAEVDLALLDVMILGSEDAGFRLAQELREAGFSGGILFLTARDGVEDKIRGLDLGGDDYLVKPFSLMELLARVRALLRRPADTRQAKLRRGALELDFGARAVTWQGLEVDLTEREFALLELLAHYPERVFSTDELLDRFFPDAGSGHAVVRVYVSKLRQKTGPELIKTVPGGYRLGV